ncbi:hypothetical protein [Caproiciproducens sp. CPB-2]|uniref:hypothetical protein n=1 Tax=Caproiciproducens sp. CPB-2 TaxID=3030017 RepID=UPI0023DACAA3|nr:hypothetical protein [Caproiciproducens sp. CPB-2]MDF1495224.1 hypothetical protein [Caproiciproducens sp. CPB-2]
MAATKIGHKVLIGCRVTVPQTGLGSGQVQIQGFPWSSAENVGVLIPITNIETTTWAFGRLMIDESGLFLCKVQPGYAAFDAAAVANVNPEIGFHFSYHSWI